LGLIGLKAALLKLDLELFDATAYTIKKEKLDEYMDAVENKYHNEEFKLLLGNMLHINPEVRLSEK